MNISMSINSKAVDEELLFVRQLGLSRVFTAIGDGVPTREHLHRLKEATSRNDIELIRVMSVFLGKNYEIHLGLPERDRRIDEFVGFLELLQEVGIRQTTFTWEPDQVWSSDPVTTRESVTRFVDVNEMKKRPFTHERAYTREEIEENFAYFIERIAPAARATGVKLLLHPNDPPTDQLGGVPCLITSRKDYERAFELAPADVLGMEFCCGCWLEGGERFGNVLEDIPYFSGEDRIGEIHFRNVSSTLPVFTETFLDDGYMNMYEIVRMLVEIDYAGTVTLDHTPAFSEWAGGRRAATAYAIAYIKALHRAARTEQEKTDA
jgi:mannonate dehydratase